MLRIKKEMRLITVVCMVEHLRAINVVCYWWDYSVESIELARGRPTDVFMINIFIKNK